MKNLNAKRFALAIFVIFAGSFYGLWYQAKQPALDPKLALTFAYKTISIVLLLVGFFVAYAWRWPIFRHWLVPFPNLNGTWQGAIQTTWKNPQTGQVPGPIPVILTIKQSFIRISCVMHTAEMTSRSFLADFWLNEDEQIRMLGYSYHSTPMPSVRERSQPHDGTIIFQLLGNPVDKLKGNYWTARSTTGEVTLTFREKRRLEEFPPDLGKHPVSGKS
ncbi:MAG: hypothetical protein C5B50_05290 [Verrucomicrobia bacterium]|nr:MAG: hypothetical protein C5B50_05290 [Verrucomicrobiota bacterium]